MNSSSESMSIAPMIDLLIVLSSGAQAPARYLPPLPAQLRRERLNCIVEPTAHTISRGIKVGAWSYHSLRSILSLASRVFRCVPIMFLASARF